MEDTQSIGSSTRVITPRHSILLRCSLTLGHKAMGHFLGACITGWASWWSQILYLLGNQPMPWNQSGNSLIKSSVHLMGLAASGAVAGLFVAAIVETGGGWVQGCLTVMAQFIFTAASFSLEGRPRIVGSGVSATYQYDFTLWGWAPGQPGCQVIGPQSAPYRGIWDPLYAVSLVFTWSRPVGRPAGLIWSGYRHQNTQRGNTLPPALVSTLTWSEAVPLLLALAGSCMVVYASLHCGAHTSLTMISLGWVFWTVVLGWMWCRAISSWGLWSSLTSMVSVLFFCPWWVLWFLGGHLDFLCCDPGGGAFLGWSGLPPWHLVPSVPFCHNWNNGSHVLGSLLCQLGAVGCSWDSPLRVQMVSNHGCCGWCGLSAFGPGRLHPQVLSCGRLVLWHVGWQSDSQQCQPAHWRVS